MPLSDTHLKYLFAIRDAAAQAPDVSSRRIAGLLEVSKPSVARILGVLMDKKLIVKAHYGKIYLTGRGAFTVRYYAALLEKTLAALPDYGFALEEAEARAAALALVAALPDGAYRAEYETLFGEPPAEHAGGE